MHMIFLVLMPRAHAIPILLRRQKHSYALFGGELSMICYFYPWNILLLLLNTNSHVAHNTCHIIYDHLVDSLVPNWNICGTSSMSMSFLYCFIVTSCI